jgi:hypothetical protein
MTWTKLDDNFALHPKLLGLSDSGFRLYVSGLNYSTTHLTDGFVPSSVPAVMLPGRTSRATQSTVSELVRAVLWHVVEGGWQIHDFALYQPSRAEVEAKREQTAERQRRHRASSDDASRFESRVTNEPVTRDITRQSHDPDPTRDPTPSLSSSLTAFETLTPPELELSAEHSDFETGLSVFVDSEGKQRRREDLLFEAAAAIWGNPATDSERAVRNRWLKELRDARCSPQLLVYAVEKYVRRYEGRVRPSLSTIVKNFGDIRDGFDVTSEKFEALKDDEKREQFRAQLRVVAGGLNA